MKRFKEFINEDYVYRGVGKRINKTYGSGSDEGMGTFWTDNLTMAKWFAGLIEYSVDTNKYEKISDDGKVLEKDINFKKPYIINENHEEYDEEYDSFHIYMNEIKDIGGVENYRNKLLKEGYDGIILEDCTTNYYDYGTYSIYIEL